MSDLPQTLLVPVDGSKNSNTAAAYAVRIAEKLGANVRLLHAFAETPTELFGVPTEYPNQEIVKYFSPEAFEALRQESATVAFRAAREAIGETRVALDEQLIPGESSQAIIEHAAGMKDVMIVMGRRGLSQFKELMMGSTTQRVLHHAKCPVLVLR